MRWNLRCDICGRFINHVADIGCMYGNSESVDPPDDTFFCDRCAEKEMQEAITHPENVIVRCWLGKPNYVRVAKSILRHKRKILHAKREKNDLGALSSL